MFALTGSNVTFLIAGIVKGTVLPCLKAKLCFLKNSIRESIAASVIFCDCNMFSIKEPECDEVGGDALYRDDDITDVGDDEVNDDSEDGNTGDGLR